MTPPDVVMLASAKRVLPLQRLTMVTRVWSAVLNEHAIGSAFAWSRVSNATGHVDRGRGPAPS